MPTYFGNPKNSRMIELELTVSSGPGPYLFEHADGRVVSWDSGGLVVPIFTPGAEVKLVCRVREHLEADGPLPARTAIGSVRYALAE